MHLFPFMPMNNENIIKSGLEAYIKKHYRIVFIKGTLLSIGLLALLFLLISASEYFLWMPAKWRFALFWAFCSFSAVLIIRFLLWPLLQYFGFNRKVTERNAAKLIGLHFPAVKDSLLNLLELEEAATREQEPQKSLMLASVKQRYKNLSGIKFTEALRFDEQKKYILLSVPAVVFFMCVWFFNPAIINDGGNRLMNYSAEFKRPLSFNFAFDKKQYTVKEGENLVVNVSSTGEKIPARVYLIDGSKRILLTKSDAGNYSLTLSDNFKSRNIFIEAGPFTSKKTKVDVLTLPKIMALKADVKYPNYTNFNTEINKDKLDLRLPEGSKITWSVEKGKNTDVKIEINDSTIQEIVGKKSFEYNIISTHNISRLSDTSTYKVLVIKDAYPQIKAELINDSLLKNTFYLSGSVADDYGISKLQVVAEDKNGTILYTKTLSVNASKQQSFFYTLENTDSVSTVYAKVWDNDAVNGAKASTSVKAKVDNLDKEELSEQLKEDRLAQLNDLEKLQKKSNKLNKKIEDVKDRLKGKKESSFEDKQKVKEINKEFKELQNEIEKSKKQNELLNFEEKKLNDFDESIVEKQQKLEELFNELLDPELQKLLEELQQQMDAENKEELEKALEDIKINNEDIEKSLDQNMEWLKKLALEKEVEETIEKLNELAEKQKELSEKDSDTEEDQNKISEEFKKLQEQVKDLDKKAEALKQDSKLAEETSEKQESVEKEQKKATDNISNSQKKQANENQKKAGQQMQEMAEQMQQMQQSAQEQQQTEDMESLRAILENLIQLSFDEEELLAKVKTTSSDDPQINAIIQSQKDVKDNFVIVEDSLNALATRVIQLAGIINKEISSINSNLASAQEIMQELQLNSSTIYQQKSMMGFNNLALLLDEVLQQMQKQMAQSKPGSSNCEKPGGSGAMPSLSELRKMQEKMGQDMEGGKKPGKKGKDGEGGMGGSSGEAKRLAKQAAQQAAIRKQIRQMADEFKDGKTGNGKKLNDIAEEMEKIEEDLVNKRPTPEILKRQQDIITRLLEAEKADLERELDKERESKTAINQNSLTKEQREKYLEQKRKEIEIIKSYPAGLKPYYKEKTDQYFEQK